MTCHVRLFPAANNTLSNSGEKLGLGLSALVLGLGIGLGYKGQS